MWMGWSLSLLCIFAILRVVKFRPTDDFDVIRTRDEAHPAKSTPRRRITSTPSPIQRLLASKEGWSDDPRRAVDKLVLVTASNSAFRVFLDNWECQTKRLGLRHVVLSMNEELHADLGPDRSLLVHNFSAEEQWGTRDYNSITCSKISGVLKILEEGYDVVFSDPDNVLSMDPLTHEFGDLIRSGKFDYLYQTQPSRKKAFLKCAPPMAKSGNIGFTYTKNSVRARQLYRDTLQACTERPEKSAQMNFWNVLRFGLDKRARPDVARFKPQRSWCTDEEAVAPGDVADTLRLCCLNTTHYKEGYRSPKVDPIVVFHANWVKGREKKVDLLRKKNLWFLDANGSCPLAN